MLRVSHSCIVVFSNFAYWKIRWHLTRYGSMPVTEQLPYEWYNTPNINLLSIEDIETMCQKENVKLLHKSYYGNGAFDNLFINSGLYNLERPPV